MTFPGKSRFVLPLLLAWLAPAVSWAACAPVVQWQKDQGPPGHIIQDVASDTGGNLIVTGQALWGGTIYFDYVEKWDAGGTVVWTKSSTRGNQMFMGSTKVAVDAAGAVYAASALSTGPSCMTLEKWSSAGALQWSQTHTSTGSVGTTSVAADMGVDPSGNLLVLSGENDGMFGPYRWVVSKFLPNGSLVWQTTLAENTSSYTSGHALAVDVNDGSVVCTGLIGEMSSSRFAAFKVGTGGGVVWSRTAIGGLISPPVSQMAVAIDASSSIWMVANMYRPLTKYGPNGSELFQVQECSGGPGYTRSIVSVGNNLYVFGDGRVAKRDSEGRGVWRAGCLAGLLNTAGPVAADASAIFVVDTHLAVAKFYETSYCAHGQLASSLSLVPANPMVGEWVKVVMSITNVGDAALDSGPCDLNGNGMSALPSLQVNAGALSVTMMDTPYSGERWGSPGETDQVVWTFSVSGTGPLSFTATLTAETTCSGELVETHASTCAGVVTARLASALSFAPPAVGTGTPFTVSLTVTNEGGVNVTGISVSLWVDPVGPVVQFLEGPAGGPYTIGGHVAQTFVWTYSANGVGAIMFTGSATGVDSGTSVPVTTTAAAVVGAYGSVIILTVSGSGGGGGGGGPSLQAVLQAVAAANPTSVREGGEVEIRLTISNTGTFAATGLMPSLLLSDAAIATVASNPTPVASLAPAACTALVWRITTHRPGLLTVTAQAVGANASAQAQVVVTVRPGATSKLTIYPNPAGGDALTIVLPLDADADEVVIDVFNSANRRAVNGLWRNVTVAEGSVQVTGVRAWSPGVYFVLARAKYAGGREQSFPVAKIVVKR